jgi:hypothetical protein
MQTMEEQVLERVLDPKTLPLPERPKVVGLKWEPYTDHLGDDELRIWVVLDEATTEDERRGWMVSPIANTVREALRKAGIRRFAYLRFLKRSEMEEMGVHV